MNASDAVVVGALPVSYPGSGTWRSIQASWMFVLHESGGAASHYKRMSSTKIYPDFLNFDSNSCIISLFVFA